MSANLTERQRQALTLAAQGAVTHYTGKSMPSLVARGLVVVEKIGGRRTGRVHLTTAGWTTVGALAFGEGRHRVVPRWILVDAGAEAAVAWYAGWHAANLAAPVPDPPATPRERS